jgi:hypothetical protein
VLLLIIVVTIGGLEVCGVKIKNHRHCIWCGEVNYDIECYGKSKLCDACQKGYKKLPGVDYISAEDWP